MRLEHVNMTVKDVDTSIAFYQQLFDFKVRWRGTIQGEKGELKAAHVGNDEYYLALFEAEQGGGGKTDYRAKGINHFAFVVDDIEKYRRRIEDAGFKIHFERDYEPGKRIYFFDSNDVEIELVEY